MNPYACSTIQKLLEKLPIEKLRIIEELQTNFYDLCYCQYGNYLIQHLIEKGQEKYKTQLREILIDKFEPMSCDKFASNVIEKAIKIWGLNFIEDVFEKVQEVSEEGQKPLIIKLIQDNYGNYVIQDLFETADNN